MVYIHAIFPIEKPTDIFILHNCYYFQSKRKFINILLIL